MTQNKKIEPFSFRSSHFFFLVPDKLKQLGSSSLAVCGLQQKVMEVALVMNVSAMTLQHPGKSKKKKENKKTRKEKEKRKITRFKRKKKKAKQSFLFTTLFSLACSSSFYYLLPQKFDKRTLFVPLLILFIRFLLFSSVSSFSPLASSCFFFFLLFFWFFFYRYLLT